MFNNAARILLKESDKDVRVVAHDWWAYLMGMGCGGRVFYDATPTLRYRQHEGNLIDMNASWAARFRRIQMLWQGRFRQWNDCNISALCKLQHKLTLENREMLERFAKIREMNLIPRLIHFKRSGICRQTLLGSLGLVVAVIFRKL